MSLSKQKHAAYLSLDLCMSIPAKVKSQTIFCYLLVYSGDALLRGGGVSQKSCFAPNSGSDIYSPTGDGAKTCVCVCVFATGTQNTPVGCGEGKNKEEKIRFETRSRENVRKNRRHILSMLKAGYTKGGLRRQSILCHSHFIYFFHTSPSL